MTFVEILVAIVLLGTVVVATLAGLRASIIGTEVDEDNSRAFAWLQAASDEVYGTAYLSCDTNTAAAIEAAYETAIASATRPNEWSAATIDITSVQFLSRSGADELWGSTCAAGNALSPLYAQLITIEVVDPDVDFRAEVEVIKSV